MNWTVVRKLRFHHLWGAFWMQFSGLSRPGRLATRIATWFAPPYKARLYLARFTKRGYVAPSAEIHHQALRVGQHVFIGDRVIIFQEQGGGPVELGDRVRIFGDAVLEVGPGGSIRVGPDTRIHRGCQLVAYGTAIEIGRDVGIAQNCAFYPYNHGMAPGTPIARQPVETRGPIVVEDHAWLGVGVIVLDGVRIGRGAVVGAGAVVTKDVPAGAIAAGVPARVLRMRGVAPGHSAERLAVEAYRSE